MANRIKVGGKFSFQKLSKEDKDKIIDNLAKNKKLPKIEKEDALLGIKIDGKPVTKELIKQLEKKPGKLKEEEEPELEKPLEKMSKKELEEFTLEKFGIDIDRRRSKKALLKKVQGLEEE